MSRARAADLAVFAVLALSMVLERAAVGGPGGAWLRLAAAVALLAVAVAIGRTLPLLSIGVALLPNLLELLTVPATGFRPYPVTFLLLLVVVSFRAGGRTDGVRRAALGVVIAMVAAVGPAVSLTLRLRAAGSTWFENWIAIAFGLVFGVVAPWMLGRYRRLRADLHRAGWLRAEHLQREQQMLVEQARLRERARIAQDMHDSLGHELGLIALQAGALEVAADLPERHRTAATALRKAAGSATDRLHDVVGLLREHGEPAAIEPAGESVEALVQRSRASGMHIGLYAAPAGRPALVDRAAYRVVQEGLTNAARHAPGAAVTIRVQDGESQTVVTVHNAPSDVAAAAGAQGGRGLLGLAERVRLFGGSLDVTRPDGGFRIRATLPHAAAEAPPALPVEDAAHEQLRAARRRARRGLLEAVLVTAGLCAVLALLTLSIYAFGRILSTP